jgi:UPF0755 protein
MTDPGAPRHGRHSSADDLGGGFPAPRIGRESDPGNRVARRYDVDAGGSSAAGYRARLLDDRTGPMLDDRTGPMLGDRTGPMLGGRFDAVPPYAARSRHAADDARNGGLSDPDLSGPIEWPAGGYVPAGGHPSAPIPPRPPGVWDRMPRRDDAGDDAPTEAHPLPGRPPVPADRFGSGEHVDEPQTDAHLLDWEDATGGLEVIGEHVDERPRRGRRAGRSVADEYDYADSDGYADEHAPEDELALHGSDRPRRRRRRPLASALVLLLLVGVAAGVIFGGRTLLGILNPTAEDFSGQGTGTVAVKVEDGDSLSAIATRLVDAGVIASAGPFVDAAEANTAATGIQPGTYSLHERMSGQAALDLMLDPAALQVFRVTIPEGTTVAATLTRISEDTGVPLADLKAAAADRAAIGLPDWAGKTPEGLLFPATYDFQPDATPAKMLAAMVTRGVQALDELQVPEKDRLTVLTKASLVQAEASSPEDMAKVARVLENRLADGMPLQLDTTVNYANGKGGLTTTAKDRDNPSPYNTYVHKGLPPGPITNPGEEALTAVLNPAAGPWRFFVVVNPDTGETRFAQTAAQHQKNVLLFQQWLQENPGG